MTRAKKNPQKTHVEWVEIHNKTLELVAQLEMEIKELKAKISLLENEKMEKQKEVDLFFEKKRKKILLIGDSHLKKISGQELKFKTGKDISLVKAYCSRKNWYGAFYPESSFSNAVEQNADETTTHIIMCAPTSDLTNVKNLNSSSRLMFADLSAKTMISTAEWCLVNYPALQKIVIFEHLPRYLCKSIIQFILIFPFSFFQKFFFIKILNF